MMIPTWLWVLIVGVLAIVAWVLLIAPNV